ncbi:MAG: permease [Pseudomonadota bacterium]
MNYLLIALVALASGPILLNALRRRPALEAALDGFVVVSISGLVFLHFLPSAVEQQDLAVLLGLGLGFLTPLVLERLARDSHGRVDRWGMFLGFSGLAIHAAIDGAALATVEGNATNVLFALALILHRLPVGVAVWWLASSRLGYRSGVIVLLALMGATVLGFYASGAAVQQATGWSVELYQAFVGGALVHVVLHPQHTRRGADIVHAEGWGALAALALMLVVTTLPLAPEADGAAPFMQRLFVLFAETAPALLLAYLFAGLLSSFLPSASIRWLGRGGSLTQAGRGMLVGLPFPICSCGVVPLYRSLVAKGAPPAAAMAFLVATPELGLDAVLLSVPLLGTDVTIIRLVTAGAAALLVGWWVGGRLSSLPITGEMRDNDPRMASTRERLREAMSTGTREIVDHTAPWILLGLAVAALVAPWLERGWLAELPSIAAIVLFAALGFPTYVCAASATPLVAALLATGLSPGAGIAFLITGPATNLSTLGIIAGLHGKRAAVAFATVLVAFAIAAGVVIDLLFESLNIPTLAELTKESPSTLQVLCLAGLLLLFGASIARRGIRSFAAEIRDGLGWSHDHDHDHHGHDHHHHHHHGHSHS